MITGSSDGTLCVWRSGKLLHSAAAHEGGGVTAVASGGGGRVWSCGGDGSLVQWQLDAAANDVMAMKEVYDLRALVHAPRSLPSSQLAATSLAVRPGYVGQV